MIRLAEQQDNLCFHCGEALNLLSPSSRYDDAEARLVANGPKVASIEHLLPRSEGGPNRIENFVVAHRDCNSKRGAAVPTEDELARLAELNERRGLLITEVRHVMEANTFGIETPASLYLMDLLTAMEGRVAYRMRRVVAQNLSRLQMDLAAIEGIKSPGQWDRIAGLIYDDCLKRSEKTLDGNIGNTVRSIMRTIINERRRRRGVGPPQRKTA